MRAEITSVVEHVGIDFGVHAPETTWTCECGWSISRISTGHVFVRAAQPTEEQVRLAIIEHRLDHAEGRVS